ncbi:unnamed protein product [Pseudo-nitzschia multistriata]|uniref:ATPase F1/V1/A1 complex alpha/beta subunit nucleotide-binding domain-containing protein n=1 Tax=Pseudo-nitzschia multistriata TaxID=183589 RepID=A0A448ZCP8_9STRA|nr:unnamed protein product [Pseudo-nitzschia multistriata]
MNLRYHATLGAALVATSSAWTSPSLLSMKRSVHHGINREQPFLIHRGFSTGNGVSTTTTSLASALAAPSSSDANTAGQPVATGSIVNVFRGGLVAARIIDDDLSKVNVSLEVDIPEVVDPSLSVPDEMKSKKKSSEDALGGDLTGREVLFGDGTIGIVVVHRPPMVFVYRDSDDSKVEEPSVEGAVTVLDTLYTLNVPKNLQRVDCFGKSVVTVGEDGTILNRPIFAPIPQVKDISLINKPLITGVTMFDALAPIGKGQNMLLIGHDLEDMRRYALDMVSIQKSKGIKCVYASSGDNENQKELKSLMESAGVEEDDIILVSSEESNKDNMEDASDAAEGIVTAATACAIGEAYALEEGVDTLVIVDNINKHKSFWDITTRSLVDVFGVDAVVKGDRDGGASSEMRAFFSSLVQRSAQYNKSRGGGSVTLLLLQKIPAMVDEKDESDLVFTPDDFEGSPAKIRERLDLLVKKNIPLTAANLRKIQIPVPSTAEGIRRLALQHVDDLISMSDGQIWLDERLQNSGRSPPMDFQRSITRIGIGADTQSRADAAAMRRVVEGLRMELSQAESMDGADFDTNASKKQLRNAQAWLLAMHQPPTSVARTLSESCVALLAASSGALNDSIDNGVLAGSEEGSRLIEGLLDHVRKTVPDSLTEIDSTLDFTDETKGLIEEAIKSYVSQN